MPQNRSYLSGGTPYPTGKSPLVLDIENNIQGVVQQMVDNKKTEIKEKKLRVSENEKMLLDALDMQAVEGMGDKVALEFGQGLEKMKDKYAKLFIERGGEFNVQDKLNLRKEKLEHEQKLKTAAAEIKEIIETKKMLAVQGPDKKGLLDFYGTSKWIADYQKSGLVGSGKFNTGIVFRQPEFGEDFKYKYSDNLKNIAKSTDETVRVLNPSTGLYESRTRTKDETMREFLKSTPEGQELMKTNPQQFESLVNDMIAENTLNKSEQGFNAGLQRQSKNNYSNRPGWGALTQEQADNMLYFNNLAEGVYVGDEAALRSLEGSVDKKLGTIKTVQYDEDKTKGDAIVLTGTNGKVERIPITKDRNLKNSVKTTKKTFMDRFSQINGKQVPNNVMNYIEADFPEFEKSQPAKPKKLISVENALSVGLSGANENIKNYNKRNPTKTQNEITKEEYQKQVIDGIKQIVPDLKIAPKPGKYWGTDKNIVQITNDDKTISYFDLQNADDRQTLSDLVTEKSKYKDRWGKTTEPTTTEKPKTETKKTTFTTEQEAVITKLMKQNPDWTRDEIIKELGY